MNVRADGRAELHIHGTLTTGIIDLHENVTLTASVPAYTWLNPLQVWARGTVNQGQIMITGYVA